MIVEKNNKEMIKRCQELETLLALWMAASQAKEERIKDLEKDCDVLRQRVIRLTRQVGRTARICRPMHEVHSAKL